MDRKSQPIVRTIIDLIISKWDIADCYIVKITLIRGFKARYRNIRHWIQFLCNAATNGIQFNSIQTATQQSRWQHSKKVSNSHCRFQNISSLKAHPFQRRINSPDNRRTGKVRIQCACSCRYVLFFCQRFF